jgi:hypothetical protein
MTQPVTDDDVQQYLSNEARYVNGRNISGLEIYEYIRKLERRIVTLAVLVADKVELYEKI